MAPGYRTNAQTRRGARAGYPEHDDFEGLPVRQWRKQWVNIVPPPEIEENKKKDRWAEELPHGMPKDSDLLPPHSLALLRAARSGCLRKRPAPADDEDGDADAMPGDKTEKKASAVDEGFRVRVWKQVPRSEEGSTISYLAKRHKDTITLPSKALATQIAGPTITKATVRRIDAAGNPYTQEVTVTDGQQVDGEVISTSVVPALEQTGQAQPAAATPTRRKPPIPQKKKGRGRGRGARGRGRILPLQGSSRLGPQDGSAMDGSSETKNESIGPDVSEHVFLEWGVEPTDDLKGAKAENEDGRPIQDVEMRDSSAVDDEGDEGDGDGDDGDDDDGDESGTPVENEDQEMEDAPALGDASFTSTAGTDALGAASNLAPPTPNPLNTDISRIEGSPLKNVLIRSPTDIPAPIAPNVTQAGTDAGSLGDAGSSGVPEVPPREFQPSSETSQVQQDTASEVINETPAGDLKPTEAVTPEKTVQENAVPETTVPETNTQESAELVSEETTTVQEMTSQDTTAQDTADQDSTAQDIIAQDSPNQDTAMSETAVPEAALPETAVPETAVPETVVPEIAVPETTVPETTAPKATVPETTVPETTVPEMTVPETTVPETTVPETTVPEMTVPETTVPETTVPDMTVPEAATQDSAEPIVEETTGVVAITSTQDSEEPAVPLSEPPSVNLATVEQPTPAEDAPPAEPSTADIPIPTSEDPKTGEAPAVDNTTAESEAPPAESGPTETSVSGTAPDPVPVESAPVTQAMTEDGTDDGSDLLGPLGASLSRQAEEDVPPPTSAPVNHESEQLDKTATGEGEAASEKNLGGDLRSDSATGE